MLLLDDNANITHLNILILGPAHVGKTALRHVFVKGSISAAASASSVGGGDRSERKEQSDRSERSERGERKARNLHVNVYDPTIEDADTVQYVLGPDPATPGYQTIALSRSESLSEPSLSQNNHNSSNNNNDRNKNNDTDRNNDRGNTPWHSPSDATHNNPHHPQTDTQSCSTTTTTSSTSITLPSHLAAIADVYQHPLTEEDIWQSQRIHRIVLTLSDIGGHPFYSTLRSSAIAAADAFMLVYDVGNRASFDAMWTFYRLIIETKWERPSLIPIMMVGNMVDNVTSDPAVAAHSGKRLRRVSTQMGQSFADLLRIPFTETTVMAPQSVKACFRMLVDVAQERGRSYVGRGMVVKAGEEAGFFGGVRRPSEGSLRVYEKHSAGGSGSGGSFAVGGMVGAPLRRMPSGNSSSGYRTAAPTASGVVLPEPAVGSIRAKRDEVFAKWKEYARSQNESVASTRQTQQQQQQQQQQAMMPTPTCLPEKPGMYQDTTTVIINRMRVPRRTESLVSVRSCESEGDNVTRGAGVGQDSGIYVESRKASFGSVGSGYGERYVRLDGKPGVGGNRTSGGSTRDHVTTTTDTSAETGSVTKEQRGSGEAFERVGTVCGGLIWIYFWRCEVVRL
ncbi:hypothetical protein BC832DRAFT_473941 [Gaertneriomyces semiglobifer]|nr:hypothetical protein BC832DRAFT_473941 [Gaertneriomyces semiglobifer]